MTKDIYFVLSDTGSVLTRLIKVFTQYPYNHVSLALDDRFDKLYSFGRRKAMNPFIGGFVVESFYEGTFRRFKNTRCQVIRLRIDVTRYQELERMIHDFESNKDHYHYDFLGLIGVLLKRPLNRERHYFCTRFVAEVVVGAAILDWDGSGYYVKPQDFSMITGTELIYEGLLREYEKA